jgi:formylglycine-generating enzyme required for sulfatase activity
MMDAGSTSQHPWPPHLDGLLPAIKVLKDQYRITGFVGEGGSGAVFSGVQDPLERPVAIKVMYPGHHARVRERFLREAQAVAGLRHPNVVTVFDFGLIDELRPFIVMELLRGHNLAVELHLNGPMTVERALDLFADCLEALAAAHDKNLIHRDLKPDNLFLSQLGTRRVALLILDFGIALFTHDMGGDGDGDTLPGSPRLTPTGQKVGTPNYLAPEYFESGLVSPAMDVYAMGLVLAEMLTGAPVVQADHFYTCVVQHLTGNLRFPPELINGPLGGLIRKATARRPEDRFPDAHAFLDALEAIRRGHAPPELASTHNPLSSSGLIVPAEVRIHTPPTPKPAPDGFARLEPGTFLMGSPDDEPGRNDDEPLHEVTLTRPLLLQQRLVTAAQWRQLLGAPPPRDGHDRPAQKISWFDAVAWCNALSTRDGLTPFYALEGAAGRLGADLRAENVLTPDLDANGWRLPTEAEWEYACRAGGDPDTTRYGPLHRVAWYDSNARRGPQPVARLEPNAWGLYDMLGNVWEWVWDRYGPYPNKRARDPQGLGRAPFRVYRGGGYSSGAALCRAANRGHALPDRRLPTIGFRVARNFT